jgi:hypothetical protein
MTMEPLLAILLLAASLAPAIAAARPATSSTAVRSILLVAIAACGMVALVEQNRSLSIKELPTMRPIAFADEEYRTSTSCKVCHPGQHQSWHASYHRTMTQLATPETVIGDFDNVSLSSGEREYQLYRDGDTFKVTLVDDIGQIVHLPIVMTTGSHHMQIYWFSLGQPGSRTLGMLPFAFLAEQQKWIPRHAAFLMPDERNLEIIVGRWNATCIRCHTTHPRARAENPNPMLADSHTAEFGISCEACHGPGYKHLAANNNPFSRYLRHLGDGTDKSITNPRKLDHRLSSQICGACHSVSSIKQDSDFEPWHREGPRYRPGQQLEDTRHLVRATSPGDPQTKKLVARDPHYLEDAFWSDGMLRVSGREYTAQQDSPCYKQGTISCLSCHEMHPKSNDPKSLEHWRDDQLKPGMRSNQACISCHPKLADEKELSRHTHHQANSTGSNCYNCHMPYTTYGLLKAIRSHQVDKPDVAVSLSSGRPNACNQCHLDKTMDWTANYLEKWYDIARPELDEDQQQVAASLLWLLKGDAGQRALMAWSYSWAPALEVSGDDWQAPFLSKLLDDPYQAVRFIAGRSLHSLPDFGQIGYDFLESDEQIRLNQNKVVDLWEKLPDRPAGQRAATILIDASGQLIWERINRLHSQRDERRVNLRE